MILIVGDKGNMAQRYKCVFDFYHIKYVGVDTGDDILEAASRQDIDKILVVTPTDTHFSILKSLIPLKKHILCEKPITKSISELYELYDLCTNHKCPDFDMVLQYRYLLDEEQQRLNTINKSDLSLYNYFKTGNDGIIWDCLQIIGLSNKDPDLGNNYYYWNCVINGERLRFLNMDHAYCRMLLDWNENTYAFNSLPFQNRKSIINMHVKTKNFEARSKRGTN